ncbi:hypothetical protein ACFCZT_24615 [Streptomyces sp. NPDC056230]|uniref:deoxynucleotide monophosphate kinase family protein n=1 Tax=Streptomyces sp. NPDC056230 TaxID=3345754 RepID=UPI0035D95F07
MSFADPLKEAALKLDPIVDPDASDYGAATLSMVVTDFGWEVAKDRHPEVRRILQHMGQGVRDLDPDFWIRQALRKVDEAEEIGLPCVITDVRYPNEVSSLRRRGFHLVFIDRPGVGPVNDHVSESAVGPDDADEVVVNDSDVSALTAKIETVWRLAYDRNARRHYARSYD